MITRAALNIIPRTAIPASAIPSLFASHAPSFAAIVSFASLRFILHPSFFVPFVTFVSSCFPSSRFRRTIPSPPPSEAAQRDTKEAWMEIGLGVDPTAGLTFPQHHELARAAAGLGYPSIWPPAGIGNDAFQTCAQWWGASAAATDGGLTTGISVVPVPIWSAPALATAAATVGELTGGRFILGIGSGSIHDAGYRHSLGLP